MDVSPDGKYVATLSEWVKVTDIESKEQVAQFSLLDLLGVDGLKNHLSDMEFDPRTGRLAVAALGERTIVFWSRESDAVREVTPELASNVSLTSIAYTSDGRMLVASDTSGRLWFCDTDTLELSFWQTNNSIARVGFLDGTRRLAVLQANTKDAYQFSVFDIVARKKLLGPTPAHNTSQFLACSPDGQFVATRGFGGLVHLWDGLDAKHIKTIGSPGEDIKSATFTRDSNYLVTGSQMIRFWDLQSLDEVVGLGEGAAANHHLDFSPNGEFLLSGALDGTVRIWKAPHLDAR